MNIATIEEKIANIQNEMKKAQQAHSTAAEQMQAAREMYNRQHGYLIGMQELLQELSDNEGDSNDTESS